MITMRRQLFGLGFIAASSLLALHAAQAMSGPSAITIDGGPLGSLSLSGGVDGYGYYLSQTNSNGHAPFTSTSNGILLANGLVELQKTTGELQFTIEVGSNGGATALGAPSIGGPVTPGSIGKLAQSSISNFSTGPLYAGYVTVAPTAVPGFTVSAGKIASLEGWESGVDWNNANQLVTDIFYVQNSQSRGVEASYATGPVSASVAFGDGFDTGVWNFIQFLGTYTINSTNSVSIYGAANLGRTGPYAKIYSGTCTFGSTEPGCFGTVGAYGAYFVNSNMIGGWYNYTIGNLNVVPEVQYVYAKADAKIGLYQESSNFGAAVFGDYTFGTSPYSVGSWIEYEDSNGPDSWFIGAKSEAIGIAVTPTWQYKDVFARASLGGLYLLNNKAYGSSYGYGNDGTGKGIFTGTLEAGLLF